MNKKNYDFKQVNSDIKSAIYCLKNNINIPKHLQYLNGANSEEAGLLSEDDRRGAIAKMIDGFKVNWKYQLGNKINELNKIGIAIDALINNAKNLTFTEDIEIDEDTDLIWTTIYMQGKVCDFKSYSEVLNTISDCSFKWEPFYKAFTNANTKNKEAENNDNYNKIIESAKKDLEKDISKIKNNNFLGDDVLNGLKKNRNKFQESLFILKEDVEWIIPIFISHDEMLYIDNYDDAGFNIGIESEIYIYPEDMNIKNAVVKLKEKEITQLQLDFINTCNIYKKHLQDIEKELRSLFNSKEILDSLADENYNSTEINEILKWYLRLSSFPLTTLKSFYYTILKSYA